MDRGSKRVEKDNLWKNLFNTIRGLREMGQIKVNMKYPTITISKKVQEDE